MIKLATDFNEYEIIATGNGEKYEKVGGYFLLRPDPQVIWNIDKDLSKNKPMDAIYRRTESKSGNWDIKSKMPISWVIKRKSVKFYIELMNFKHICLFPEQAVNWDIMTELIKNRQVDNKECHVRQTPFGDEKHNINSAITGKSVQSKNEIKVLNLFAYTGAASVICALAGANVTHVDAAKSMIEIAKKNASLNNITNIRYILDDCIKFVEKEIRRGNKYDAIIMDPPSFGRGPNKEVWKIEDDIFNFVKLCSNLLSDNPLFVLINSYTTGLQASVMENILNTTIKGGETQSYEIGLPTKEHGIVLPCGNSAIKTFN